MMRRFSYRLQKLDATYLNDVLRGDSRYDRIAGYFSSSLLEIAGEAVEAVTGTVRIICNSDLYPQDVLTARAAEQALKREWTSKVWGGRVEMDTEKVTFLGHGSRKTSR